MQYQEMMAILFFAMAPVLALLLLVFLAPGRRQRPDIAARRGREGEQRLAAELAVLPGRHRILTNCYVPTARMTDFGARGTTEIDVILLHETGLYVFESKNYSGRIRGTEQRDQWTQTFASGRRAKRFSFYNPIRQNSGHIYWLARFLHMPQKCFFSVVVFGNACSLEQVRWRSRNVMVLQLRDVWSFFRNRVRGPVLYSEEQIEEMYARLLPLTTADRATVEQHIASVRRRQA